MATKLQITIPEPCHEQWDQMTPIEQGRFCGSCQKQVVDFSTMSDQQLIAYFKQPAGSLCGRFHGDQLNRTIAIPKKRLPWVRYFFQIMLPAFLLSFKASGQRATKGKLSVQCVPTRLTGEIVVAIDTVSIPKEIQGKVVDVNGIAINNATVAVKGKNLSTATNKEGKFVLKTTSLDMPLVISAPGYSVLEIAIASMPSLIVLEKPLQGHLGGFVAAVRIDKDNTVPLIRKIKDTINKRLTVYPNPAFAGSFITISGIPVSSGEFQIEMEDSGGKVIYYENKILEKQDHLQVQIPQLTTGVYFVRLTNQKGRTYTSSLIIH